MRDFYHRAWSMPEKMLLTAATLLLGIVVGFLFSPVKKGIYCNNNNNNNHAAKPNKLVKQR